MPMLFSLGQHAAMMAVAARLRDGVRLLAFLDDLFIVTSLDRTVEVHNMREELRRHARISVRRETRIWNRAGIMFDGCHILEQAARAVGPAVRVWRGNHADRVESRNHCPRHPSGTPGICETGVVEDRRRARQFAPENSGSQRPPVCMVVALVLWCCEGDF